jgi:two-component system nitrogen regulation sensor histidine kinase NtrY
VISHEINNSLAPIKSVAHSLERLLTRDSRSTDWENDLRDGLGVISARADALGRFTAAYAQLARLPAPKLRRAALAPIVGRVSSLERRRPVIVTGGPNVTLQVDADQIEQLLINLLSNAVEATIESGGHVTVGWQVQDGRLQLTVEDDGPGVSNPANLFVPFFTTKPGGSGIGLVLSRQIAEAHGGTLTLENRQAGPGCRATLVLPI